MEQELISLISVLLFCLCSHQFIKTVVTPIPLLRTERTHSRAAMQLAKFYKAMAWGTMTSSFLVALVFSFYTVFTTL